MLDEKAFFATINRVATSSLRTYGMTVDIFYISGFLAEYPGFPLILTPAISGYYLGRFLISTAFPNLQDRTLLDGKELPGTKAPVNKHMRNRISQDHSHSHFTLVESPNWF